MTEGYFSKDLDRLGIVSPMCDEINLVNVIDPLDTRKPSPLGRSWCAC